MSEFFNASFCVTSFWSTGNSPELQLSKKVKPGPGKHIVAWMNNILSRAQHQLLKESIKEISMHLDEHSSFREGIQTAAQLISAVQNYSKRLSQLAVHIHAGNVQPL